MVTKEDEVIFTGVVGHEFRILITENNVAKDISAATTKTIKIKRPDGTVLTVSADFLTTGADGYIRYLSLITDLNTSGTYYIQAYLELPTWQGHSEIKEFEVFAPLG
jgi:hypothetical protein